MPSRLGGKALSSNQMRHFLVEVLTPLGERMVYEVPGTSRRGVINALAEKGVSLVSIKQVAGGKVTTAVGLGGVPASVKNSASVQDMVQELKAQQRVAAASLRPAPILGGPGSLSTPLPPSSGRAGMLLGNPTQTFGAPAAPSLNAPPQPPMFLRHTALYPPTDPDIISIDPVRRRPRPFTGPPATVAPTGAPVAPVAPQTTFTPTPIPKNASKKVRAQIAAANKKGKKAAQALAAAQRSQAAAVVSSGGIVTPPGSFTPGTAWVTPPPAVPVAGATTPPPIPNQWIHAGATVTGPTSNAPTAAQATAAQAAASPAAPRAKHPRGKGARAKAIKAKVQGLKGKNYLGRTIGKAGRIGGGFWRGLGMAGLGYGIGALAYDQIIGNQREEAIENAGLNREFGESFGLGVFDAEQQNIERVTRDVDSVSNALSGAQQAVAQDQYVNGAQAIRHRLAEVMGIAYSEPPSAAEIILTMGGM